MDGAGEFVAGQILGLAGTLSFLLGLLVIPVWILTLVSDERKIKGDVAGMIAPAIRGDMVALARIVDRVFGTFLRVQVVLAIVVGFLIWVGLEISRRSASPSSATPSRRRCSGRVLQLIPELGYFLGFFPDAAGPGHRRGRSPPRRSRWSTSSPTGSAATSWRHGCRVASWTSTPAC